MARYPHLSMPSESAGFRPLGFVEHLLRSAHRFGGFQMARAVLLDGDIELEVLRRAVRSVQLRHPLLCASIGTQGGLVGFHVSRSADDVELIVVDREDAGQWQRVMLRWASVPYDEGKLLWRIIWVRREGEAESELILAMHHSIGDGRSATQIITEIVTLLASPADHIVTPLSLTPSADRFCTDQNWVRCLRFWINVYRQAFLPPAALFELDEIADADARRSSATFRSLSADDSRLLFQMCRSQGTSVYGALCAAMLTRAWREIGASRESMSVHANCDLRRRVVPPLPQELVGCFIYWVDLRYRLSGREPFWELARRCTRDMQRRIRHCGMPPTIIATQRLWLNRAAEMMMRRSANNARGGRTDTIGISNLGRISGLHDNEAVRIRGMHTLTSQHAFGVCMALFGLTLANRLSLSFLHPVPVISSLRAERFADAIVTILQTIVADTAIDVRRLAD